MIIVKPLPNADKTSWSVVTCNEGGSTQYHHLIRGLSKDDAELLAHNIALLVASFEGRSQGKPVAASSAVGMLRGLAQR